MTIAVTGPDGFLAWHVRCAIRARFGGDAILIGRPEYDNPSAMDLALSNADSVIHLAGVNRASDAEISDGNPKLARKLVESLTRIRSSMPVVYANSIQAELDNVYGRSKARAAEILAEWGTRSGAPVCDVLMPNIFGEHGRPNYNSAISTFCDSLAKGAEPQLVDDKRIEIRHAQSAAKTLIDLAQSASSGKFKPGGHRLLVSEVIARLRTISANYDAGDLPDLSDALTRDLFNTYRSYTFPQSYPIFPAVNGDDRGELFESVRALGGQTQVFFSTTRPGKTRGNHYHLHKVERFLVVQGNATISLRKLFSEEVVDFEVSGERPGIIDMPTLWVHNITNTGDTDLITLFFADAVYDPANPDTYPEGV